MQKNLNGQFRDVIIGFGAISTGHLREGGQVSEHMEPQVVQ